MRGKLFLKSIAWYVLVWLTEHWQCITFLWKLSPTESTWRDFFCSRENNISSTAVVSGIKKYALSTPFRQANSASGSARDKNMDEFQFEYTCLIKPTLSLHIQCCSHICRCIRNFKVTLFHSILKFIHSFHTSFTRTPLNFIMILKQRIFTRPWVGLSSVLVLSQSTGSIPKVDSSYTGCPLLILSYQSILSFWPHLFRFSPHFTLTPFPFSHLISLSLPSHLNLSFPLLTRLPVAFTQ